MSLLLVFLNYALWSSVFTFGRATVESTTPFFLTGVRMGVAGVMILLYLWWKQPEALRIKSKDLFSLGMLAVFAVYLTNVLEFWGLQYLTAAKTCFLYSLSPFVAALLSYLQFKEKVTVRKWCGLAIGFIGFVPVLLTQSGKEELLGGISILSWAEIAVLGAVFCSMYGWVLLRKLVKDCKVSPLMANGSSMAIGGVFALANSWIIDIWDPIPVDSTSVFVKGTLLMILISNLICTNVYAWLLKRYTATFLSFAGLLTPIFAAIVEWFVLGETVSWAFLASTGIVLFGLWIVYKEELRLGYMAKLKQLNLAGDAG